MAQTSINFLLTSGNAIRDAFSGKWSFIDIFTTIALPKDPGYAYQSFYVCGRINNVLPGNTEVVIRIDDPDGKLLKEEGLSGTMVKGDVLFATAFYLLKIERTGRYTIHASINGKALSDGDRYYIDVVDPS